MLTFFISLFIISLSSGQLIKLPLVNLNGLILLDAAVIILNLTLLFKIKFQIKSLPNILKHSLPFLIICLISLIFTPLKLSINEYLISIFYFIRLLNYLILAALLSLNHFKDYKQKLALIFVTSGLILSVLGLLQIIFIPSIKFLEIAGWDPHLYRVVSTWLDPNYLGAFFVLTLILLSQKEIPPIYKKVKTILFFVVFISLLLTFSRSALFMFAASFTTLSFFKKSLKFFALTFFLTLILYAGVLSYGKIVASPNKINRDQSANSRVITWKVGLSIIQKSPLLGAGFNSYRYALDQYHLVPSDYLESRASSGNDSSLLFILATTGIAGLITYLYFLFSLVKSSWKNSSKIIFISGLAGLIIHSFFNNSLFYPPLMLWLWLMFI